MKNAGSGPDKGGKKSTDDITDDVKERLASQERAIIIEQTRARVRAQLEEESQDARSKNREIVEDENSLYLSDEEENAVDDIDNYFERILNDDELDLEYVVDPNVSKSKKDDDEYNEIDQNKGKLGTESDSEFPSLQMYLENLCIDPNIVFDDQKIQTARLLIEIEHPRRREPDMRSLILSVLRKKKENGQDYNCGEWVEILGKYLKCKQVRQQTYFFH